MSTGHKGNNYLIGVKKQAGGAGDAQAVGNGETNTVVSEEFVIYAEDSRTILIDVEFSAAPTATATFKLQDSFDGVLWFDKVSTTSVATLTDDAGATRYVATLKLDVRIAGDQTYLPLRPRGRIVVTTDGTGDANVTRITKTDRR